MDDRFLNELRRDPDPVFARTLRQTLRDQEAVVTPRPARRWMPALAAAGVAAAVALLFAFPQVRDTALAFLDLFRVRQFVAVSVSENRIQQMKDQNLDLAAVLGSDGKDGEVIKSAGPSQVFPSAAAASAIAGYMPKTAYDIPSGLMADTVWVDREGSGEVTLHMDKLRDIVQALDLRGVDVPMQLNGQRITVRHSVVVRQRWSDPARPVKRRASLIQTRSPEIGLPPGADLAQLGEIGLRIMGLDATEAHRFAQSIDWGSTVVVPVPATSGAFREVEVNGHKALMVSSSDSARKGAPPGDGTVILWSENDMVYAVCGNVDLGALLQMANSVR